MAARRLFGSCLPLVCALVILVPGASATPGTSGLMLGFSDDYHLTSGSDAQRAPWIARAIFEGASIVRVNLAWSQVAPGRRPGGFDPTNPDSAGYHWSGYDELVSDLVDHGLQVLFTISSAPTWAEGPHRPRWAAPGTWRPDPRQLANFATAAAIRYSGHFPNASIPGAVLPHVRFWEVWNEPNLDGYLSPQWLRTRHGWAPVAPVLYRQLANAAYSALKRVSPSNFVVIGATAPYGDPAGFDPSGKERTAPVAFYRTLLCVRGARRLTPMRCPDPAHFDALDHHPYGVGGPTWHAINPDDVAVPDIYKITRVLSAALRTGRARPRSPKAVWVTEFGWSSRPPNPAGVPVLEDARWYEQALYVLWRQGADTILPLELGDPAGVTNYEAIFESGLYYSDGRPKPIATAFRFPLVAWRAVTGDRVSAWGRAPANGSLQLQTRRAGRWRTVLSFRVRARQVFLRTFHLRGAALVRAMLDRQASLGWSVGR